MFLHRIHIVYYANMLKYGREPVSIRSKKIMTRFMIAKYMYQLQRYRF